MRVLCSLFFFLRVFRKVYQCALCISVLFLFNCLFLFVVGPFQPFRSFSLFLPFFRLIFLNCFHFNRSSDFVGFNSSTTIIRMQRREERKIERVRDLYQDSDSTNGKLHHLTLGIYQRGFTACNAWPMANHFDASKLFSVVLKILCLHSNCENFIHNIWYSPEMDECFFG